MEWSVGVGKAAATVADLLVVAVPEGRSGPDFSGLESLDSACDGGLGALVDGRVFAGRKETSALLPGRRCAAPWLLLAGLGRPGDLTLERLRRCAGTAAAQARRLKARRCALLLPDDALGGFDPQAVARAWVEGTELALGAVERLRGVPAGGSGNRRPRATDDEADAAFLPDAWQLVESGRRRVAALTRGLAEGRAYAAGCLFARRLVNLPPNVLTPSRLADEARGLARAQGYACRALGPAGIAKLGMGGLLGVARGSRQEPRLILLESPPVSAGGRRRRLPLVALVGKGLTFDSGGLSLKAAARMEQMKDDMGGAAAVLGAALIVARLQLPVRLLVVIPAAENLPGGDALRPGDVITMASGRTVEVMNTDAEGRLVLGDALHHACGARPDWLIDAATLTGACAVALGEQFAGLMGSDARLLAVLDRAGGDTCERVWPLPLLDEHRRSLRSDVADCKNIGPRDGSALTAAAFLSFFVDEAIPWAHIDMAGPVWTDTAGPLGPKGATGYGARLLARAVQLLVS